MPQTESFDVTEVLFCGDDAELLANLNQLLPQDLYPISSCTLETLSETISDFDETQIIILAIPDDCSLIENKFDVLRTSLPFVPIIAIINEGHDDCGAMAIGKGVQDILVKPELTSVMVRRTIRFSIERMLANRFKDDSDRLFGIMLEFGQDIITLISEDGTIIYESPNIQRLAGYAPEDLIGVNLLDIVHPDDKQFIAEKISESLQNDRTPISVATKFMSKSGDWLEVEAVGRNFLNDPAAGCIVINSRIINSTV